MVCARHAVVVTHSRLRESGTVVSEAVDRLRNVGFEVSIIDNVEAPQFGGVTHKVDEDTEIVVVLGGDGTILRAAELVHCTQVPILGVNMGHVGFLAEFESFQMSEAIRRVADHDYSIDERMIAHVDVWLPGAHEPLQDWALNDITLERADRGKMVELSVRVDDVEMSSFGCDGVIVSTPTGSTAYAFSAGGPIMWPNVKALQLVPLAAHALFAHRCRLDVHSGHPRRFVVRRLDLLRRTTAVRPAEGDPRRGARVEEHVAAGPVVRCAVHKPSGHQIRSAGGRMARAREERWFLGAAHACKGCGGHGRGAFFRRAGGRPCLRSWKFMTSARFIVPCSRRPGE